MHLLQAFLIWSFVSGLVIGGALAFRRFFPEESPWFGFFVPPLALVLLLNFVEHFIALPNLLWLLPVLVGLVIWLAATAKFSRRELVLPSLIFLAAFAFTFGIRCFQPDILPTSDGLSDLNKINDYCQGDTLPPLDTWLPPFHYIWYYSLQHYAGSIVKRLFNIPLGVAYNTTHALLTALTCVAGAAAAHRLSGGSRWITWTAPFLILSATTGTSAYIMLTMKDPSLWYANNPSGGVLDYDKLVAAGQAADANPLWKWLALDPNRERLELQVPGFWIWRDEFHANSSGHFLTLLAVLVIAELMVLRRTIWPWLIAIFIPLLAVVSSTWAYPITLLLCGGTVLLALAYGRRPAPLALAGSILLAGLILIWPTFYDVTSSPEAPGMMLTHSEWRAPLREFLVQWWPIILLWICGWCYFRHLSPAIRWVLFVIPIMLLGVELITVEGRYNTVEKMWGYTYGVGLIALFPIVAHRAQFEELGLAVRQRWSIQPLPFPFRELGFRARIAMAILLLGVAICLGWLVGLIFSSLGWTWIGGLVAMLFILLLAAILLGWLGNSLPPLFRAPGLGARIVTLIIVLCALINMAGWLRGTFHWIAWDEVGHLEGNHYLTNSGQKNRILQVLAQMKHQTFLSGKSVWCYNESPSPAVFTGNRSYIAWYYFESVADYADEAEYRSKLNNAFYSGNIVDPLKFLLANKITGVLIWPDDAIPDDYLATLTAKLDPTYEYIDCRGTGAQNAGVFLRRPLPDK